MFRGSPTPFTARPAVNLDGGSYMKSSFRSVRLNQDGGDQAVFTIYKRPPFVKSDSKDTTIIWNMVVNPIS